MNLYDCFMYFDEDIILDLRLHILNQHVKKFVVTESTFTHNGKGRKLKFDINNFKKFKDKINYVVVDKNPIDIEEVYKSDTIEVSNSKILGNALKRENFQRNKISQGLGDALEDDFIIISDVDEIPNLDNINLKKKN